jgi:type II secretory pathway pseudopilin PulG
MVIAIVGLLAALVLPRFEPSINDGLESAAQVLSADLAYARNLAVTNGSSYRWTFNIASNQCVLDHSGTNLALEVLPPSPFRRLGDPADRLTTDFDDLPHLGPAATLVAAQTLSGTWQSVADVEFGPLGSTTRVTPTVVWLGAGAADNRRYLSVSIDPVTGLAAIGQLQATPPPAATGAAISSGP